MQTIRVAVAVIINQQDQVLIARRAAHQHQGNKWEFPGGKVEADETSQQALRREINEEIGIQIESAVFITDILYQYNDKKVLLNVYRVESWQGEAMGKEGQAIKWIEKKSLDDYDFPAANAEIISYLQA